MSHSREAKMEGRINLSHREKEKLHRFFGADSSARSYRAARCPAAPARNSAR